ncbi:MAG: ABC transporter ATP-binding protein [Chloroflexota bacterium]|nr:ABC transporter ATP-binding protein [Chloroflexota bacterium]
MFLLETVDLCQKRGTQDILRNINLKVERGEVFALIGPTGAGKTTLLRLLDLLEMPASGKIYFDGVDTATPNGLRLEMRRRMAFVLQKPVVFNMSVFDNIACGLRWRGVAEKDIHERVDSMLERVSLSAYRDRNARTLSGGEAQRVAIARALATRPELLLLDEPTANLDPLSTGKIEALITDISQQHETTIIMSTHDMVQGQRLAIRLAVMMNGEIHQMGQVAEVFTAPNSREVAEFVGVENIVDGVVTANEEGLANVDADGKSIEVISGYPAGEKVHVCIRPEDITLALSPISSSARNSFAGRIRRVVPAGPLARVEVDCGFPLTVLVTKRSAEGLALSEGKPVYAIFKATAVHVIKREKN